jgi:hypothetical protein
MQNIASIHPSPRPASSGGPHGEPEQVQTIHEASPVL